MLRHELTPGYKAVELKEMGFSVKELAVSYTAHDLVSAEFPKEILLGSAGISLGNCWEMLG